MRLNGQQIADQGLVTNITDDKQIQQVGIDLQVIEIHACKGVVLLKDKTILKSYEKITARHLYVNLESGNITHYATPNTESILGWLLSPGAYSVTFQQGVRIPEDHSALIVHRTSLMRGGNKLCSGMWDPGFECKNMGSVMHITEETFIEVGARIAQIYFDSNEPCPAERLYNGQWQGK